MINFLRQLFSGPIVVNSVTINNQSVITAICPPLFFLGRIRVKLDVDGRIFNTFLFVVNPDSLPQTATVTGRLLPAS